MSSHALLEYTETITGAGNGVAVLLPIEIYGVAVTLQIISGTAKVQSTTDSISNVQAGTAQWVDWPAGAVAVTTQDYARAVTALRAVCVSGQCKVMMRGQ